MKCLFIIVVTKTRESTVTLYQKQTSSQTKHEPLAAISKIQLSKEINQQILHYNRLKFIGDKILTLSVN